MEKEEAHRLRANFNFLYEILIFCLFLVRACKCECHLWQSVRFTNVQNVGF